MIRIRQLTARAADRLDGLRVMDAPSRAEFRRASAAPHPDGPTVVLGAPGGGNIGDQAMLEAVIDGTPGPVVVIVRDPDDVRLRERDGGRVELAVLPKLIYGTRRERAADLARFRTLVGGARAFLIMGADIMDGRYSVRGSVRRAGLAEGAAVMGLPTRVLGFSWNGSPRRGAQLAVLAAARAGVPMLARDPISAARLRESGVPNVREVADLAFAARTVDPEAAERFLAAVPAGTQVALVNMSAFVSRSLDQLPDYVRIVEHLRDRGVHVVLLPHVLRGSANDLDSARRLLAAVGTRGVTLVDEPLRPAQVRGFTARASVTVTGRMHLAILSLVNRVPAIAFVTQGKVEGLMRLFDLPELAIAPRPGAVDDILPLLDEALDGDRLQSAIGERLPAVIELAHRNLDQGSSSEPVPPLARRSTT